MRTAVILSGGGAKAAYEAGVLKALEDNQIPVDLVIGTSAGALNALLYSLGETERLYNGQGTGIWQRMNRSMILRDGMLSTFYSRVVSWKLAFLASAISLFNLLFFSLGFSLAFGTGRYLSFGKQKFSKALDALSANYVVGIFYGILFLAVVLIFEYLFMGSVLHTIYRWLKIKLGLNPINDESLKGLQSAARRIPNFTRRLLTRWLRLPKDVLDPDRLVESIHGIDPPTYYSSSPLEELLRREVQDALEKREVTASAGSGADLGLTTVTWLQSRLQLDKGSCRGLMITATDLNAKSECLFFAIPEVSRRDLVAARLARYQLDPEGGFIHSQGIDHVGPDFVDLLHDENGRLLFDALMASTSIIGFFPPRKIKFPDKGYWRSIEPPHTFVDGGFGNNTPIRDAIDAGATHLIVVQVEPKNVVETLGNPEELNATLPCLLRTVETVLDTTVDDDYRYYELWNKYAPRDQRVKMIVIQPKSALCVSTLDFDGGLSPSGNKVPLSSVCARGYSDALKQFIYSDWIQWKEEVSSSSGSPGR